MKLADAEFCGEVMTDLNKERIRLQADNDRLRAAVAPFLRYYDDIRFNLRKQPRPTDAAIEEHGERDASVTWAEFYALRDACEQTVAGSIDRGNAVLREQAEMRKSDDRPAEDTIREQRDEWR